MTRLLKVVPTTLLLVLAVTSPAYATFSEWLDKLGELSGPGPFKNKFFGSALSVDVVCLEGKWWQKPVVDRRDPAVIAVTAALAEKIDDPFEITRQIRIYLTARAGTGLPAAAASANAAPAAQQAPAAPSPDLTARLQKLFKDDPATVEAARQVARLAFWRLREELLDPAAGGPSEARLRALIKDHQFHYDDTVDKMTRGDISYVTGITDSTRITVSPYCTGDLRRQRYSFGVYAAWLTTSKVPRDYHYAPDIESLPSDIDAMPLAITARVSLPVSERHPIVLRSWDVGVSGGMIQFTGDRFQSFWLGYWEFPRITYRPLAFVACKGGKCPAQWTVPWDLVELEFVTKWIPGVEAKQFGASGPASGQHVQWAFRAGVSYKVLWDRFPHDFVK